MGGWDGGKMEWWDGEIGEWRDGEMVVHRGVMGWSFGNIRWCNDWMVR